MLTALAGVVAATLAVAGCSRGDTIAVGRNILVNSPRPIDANNSPSLARNPRHPANVVVSHRVDRPAFSAEINWSDNGGTTWRATALPLPGGLDRPFAPDVAFGPDGRLYVTYVNLTGNGNTPDNLWIASSSDGGRSLSPPVRITGPLAFQARVAVGPEGTVYVTWMQASDVGIFRLVGPPAPILVARSTDGGTTFSDPVRVSDASRERVGAASPVVDSRGRLLVLYEDFKGDRRDFEFLEGPPWDEPFALVLGVSADGGRTFAPGVELESGVVPTRRFWVFLPEFPSLAVGPADRLYVSWADGRNGDEDVFVRRSDDGGATWAPPVRVNDNPQGDGTSQYLPRVAVAPLGRVDLVFLDRRRDRRNVRADAFFATSVDGGRTFRTRRVSTRSFSSQVGPEVDPILGIDFGSRLGISSTAAGALVAWTDTRFGTPDSGRQDIAAARVSVRTPVEGRR